MDAFKAKGKTRIRFSAYQSGKTMPPAGAAALFRNQGNKN
jgi:hypothetical protein